jgi:hypothetical protein
MASLHHLWGRRTCCGCRNPLDRGRHRLDARMACALMGAAAFALRATHILNTPYSLRQHDAGLITDTTGHQAYISCTSEQFLLARLQTLYAMGILRSAAALPGKRVLDEDSNVFRDNASECDRERATPEPLLGMRRDAYRLSHIS